MYISLWENSRGHPDNISFMQFSTKIYGFKQKDSQGFENSYNSYEQYPLEKFFIFTIYQNYTLALKDVYQLTTLQNSISQAIMHGNSNECCVNFFFFVKCKMFAFIFDINIHCIFFQIFQLRKIVCNCWLESTCT